jgi:hypothetical protein
MTVAVLALTLFPTVLRYAKKVVLEPVKRSGRRDELRE